MKKKIIHKAKKVKAKVKEQVTDYWPQTRSFLILVAFLIILALLMDLK